ncbi:MAG: SPOR domain-containing protein [Alphaproteobacteria bacterium]|nr:SPOR domain-containing protein [Alphaproteobacteria bacterium]
MSTRSVILASVCSAFLAASAAVAGTAFAATSENSKLVSDAYKALQAGDTVAAATAYSQAIESRGLEPEVLANALLNRGLAFQRLNEHARAIDDYTAAMRIDAMSAQLRALALYNRGLSYQKLDQDSRAIEDFTSALFLDAKFSHAYYSRGVALRDGGQYLFALADFDKAIRFEHPEPARVYFAEALTYERLERPENAKESLGKALAANPAYEPAQKRLAALNGTQEPAVPAASADGIATATIATNTLPEASAPSAALLTDGSSETVVEVGQAGRKKITDRVPVEQAPVRVAVAEPEEKIIAIEPVAEEPAAEQAAEVPAEEPAAEPASEPQRITGWSVQLASATTEDAAWSTWKKMKARHKVLADKDPVVVRADLGTKGTFYRVRLIGFDNQGDASSACSKLKSKGVKCFISKASS